MAGAERGFRSEVLIGSKCTAGNTKPSEDNVVDPDPGADDDAYRLQIAVGQRYSGSNYAFEDVSTLDFGKVEYVINRGYSDAIDAMPLIRSALPAAWA